MSRWESFDPLSPLVRSAPGVYVVFCAGHPLYIGQSDNVRKRLSGYQYEEGPSPYSGHPGIVMPWGWGPWSLEELYGKVSYSRRFGEHLMREARLIWRVGPYCNLRGMRRG